MLWCSDGAIVPASFLQKQMDRLDRTSEETRGFTRVVGLMSPDSTMLQAPNAEDPLEALMSERQWFQDYLPKMNQQENVTILALLLQVSWQEQRLRLRRWWWWWW